jgi:hypothetical protein
MQAQASWELPPLPELPTGYTTLHSSLTHTAPAITLLDFSTPATPATEATTTMACVAQCTRSLTFILHSRGPTIKRCPLTARLHTSTHPGRLRPQPRHITSPTAMLQLPRRFHVLHPLQSVLLAKTIRRRAAALQPNEEPIARGRSCQPMPVQTTPSGAVSAAASGI